MKKLVSLFIILSIALFTTTLHAADVSLRWDANEPAPTGYRIYASKGDEPYDYGNPLYEGTATICTLTGLEETVELKFVARAYLVTDEGEYESADSIEVRHAVIRAPLNLRTN